MWSVCSCVFVWWKKVVCYNPRTAKCVQWHCWFVCFCYLQHCFKCPLNIIIFIITILETKHVLLIVINIIKTFYCYRVGQMLTGFIWLFHSLSIQESVNLYLYAEALLYIVNAQKSEICIVYQVTSSIIDHIQFTMRRKVELETIPSYITIHACVKSTSPVSSKIYLIKIHCCSVLNH